MEKKIVLLAEDSEDDAFLIQRAFRQAGVRHPLIVLEDGEQVIHYLAGEGIYQDRVKYPVPVLLLLDLKMPLKGGFEVLQWIRSHPHWKSLIVIILTSLDFPRDIEKAYDLGANSLVLKPNEPSKLVETLKHIDWFWLTINTGPTFELPNKTVCSVTNANPRKET